MGDPKEEGWDDSNEGTAVAGESYSAAIARSEKEPDFESETGTAVAGNDYVENIRKSAAIATPVVPTTPPGGLKTVTPPAGLKSPTPPAGQKTAAPTATPGVMAQRSPTMAFGTPVLLRAPAGSPESGGKTPAPSFPSRAPAGPVTRLPTEPLAADALAGAPAATKREVPTGRSASLAKPFVPTSIPAIAKPAASHAASRRASTEPEPVAAAARAATPTPTGMRTAATATGPNMTRKTSMGIAAVTTPRSTRPVPVRKPAPSPFKDEPFDAQSAAPNDVADARSGRISAPVLPPAPAAPPTFDEDSSADLASFDDAPTIGQPSSSQPIQVQPQKIPAPLRRSSPILAAPAPDPAGDPYDRATSSPLDAHDYAAMSEPARHDEYAAMSEPARHEDDAHEDDAHEDDAHEDDAHEDDTRHDRQQADDDAPAYAHAPPSHADAHAVAPRQIDPDPYAEEPPRGHVSRRSPMPYASTVPASSSPLPETYPVVTRDSMPGYPMVSRDAPTSAPAPRAANRSSRRRMLWIVGGSAAVVAMGIVGYLLFTGPDSPHPSASTTTAAVAANEPAKKADKPSTKAVTDGTPEKSAETPSGNAVTENATDKPVETKAAAIAQPSTAETATTATAETATTKSDPATNTNTKALATTTTATTPATKTTKKTVTTKRAKIAAAPKRKVVKKAVAKRPVKRPPARKTAAKPCSGLDCL